ncbi:MAG: hypothetical protein HY046_04795 [Acidobacteria bacterium]|nr:hypothetical protein [Acidobacteriota bacterium]
MANITIRYRQIQSLVCALAMALVFLLAVCAAQQNSPNKASEKASAPAPEAPVDRRIAQIKRVCIQRFGEDALGFQVQEMVIARLFESKRFSLTENCDKADYVLKGTITERSDRISRSESEGIGFEARASGSEWDRSGGDSAARTARGNAHENLSSSEVKVQAAVTLRVVDKDGEILWATSQESAGGKAKGAIGDAAERAVRRLLRDIERAEKEAAKP